MSNRMHLAATVVVGLMSFSGSALAATTINVAESGEDGGPMTISVDQSTVHSGPAVFNVKNDAMAEEHEFVLVRLDSADTKIPVDRKSHRIDEDSLKSLGEVEDLKPGASGSLTADLEPGTYLLFCNIKGHYESGMHAKLTVVD